MFGTFFLYFFNTNATCHIYWVSSYNYCKIEYSTLIQHEKIPLHVIGKVSTTIWKYFRLDDWDVFWYFFNTNATCHMYWVSSYNYCKIEYSILIQHEKILKHVIGKVSTTFWKYFRQDVWDVFFVCFFNTNATCHMFWVSSYNYCKIEYSILIQHEKY